MCFGAGFRRRSAPQVSDSIETFQAEALEARLSSVDNLDTCLANPGSKLAGRGRKASRSVLTGLLPGFGFALVIGIEIL